VVCSPETDLVLVGIIDKFSILLILNYVGYTCEEALQWTTNCGKVKAGRSAHWPG